MKINNTLLVGLALSFVSQLTFAIEATEDVKVTPLLKTQESWDGVPIHYPAGDAQVTIVEVEVAPGGETGWHLHPVASFGVVLQGELEVELQTGETLYLKTGEAAAETVDVLHNGRNTGTVPVKMVVFYTGNSESVLTVRENAAD
jgi:quercetin dioxygenase-like cupin family protein